MDAVSIADLRRWIGARPDEVVEVCVADDFRPVKARRFSRVFFPRARGRVGMEIAFRGEVVRIAPTRMLAANLGFERALENFLDERGVDPADFTAKGGLRVFSARQYLLAPGRESEPVELYRGAPLVDPAPSGGEGRAANLAGGIGRWMAHNLSAYGALPYKYWPSRGTESPADNAIRRFLASSALARLGELRGSAEFREAARRNLRFNLKRYFQDIGGGRGAIVESTGAKLGAAAVAGLAILKNQASEEFSEELVMLAAGVDSLADDELGFRTFFFPPERDGENWNFYSGEALLFWAEAVRRGLPFAPTLEHCAEAFERCCARHLRKTESRLCAMAHPGLCVAVRADRAPRVRGLRLRAQRLALADAAVGRTRSGSPREVLRSAPARVRSPARGVHRGVPRRARGRCRARASARRPEPSIRL